MTLHVNVCRILVHALLHLAMMQVIGNQALLESCTPTLNINPEPKDVLFN